MRLGKAGVAVAVARLDCTGAPPPAGSSARLRRARRTSGASVVPMRPGRTPLAPALRGAWPAGGPYARLRRARRLGTTSLQSLKRSRRPRPAQGGRRALSCSLALRLSAAAARLDAGAVRTSVRGCAKTAVMRIDGTEKTPFEWRRGRQMRRLRPTNAPSRPLRICKTADSAQQLRPRQRTRVRRGVNRCGSSWPTLGACPAAW